jgi:hypothetical protein
MGSFYIPKVESITIRREGARVQLIGKNGTLLLDLPWDAARDLAKAIRLQSARAEQTAKVEAVISDQAFCIRKGIPLALTPNPEVFKEAGNEAAHDRFLRRAMPGGIPEGVKFGFPSVRGNAPKARIGCRGIPSAEKVGNIGGRG